MKSAVNLHFTPRELLIMKTFGMSNDGIRADIIKEGGAGIARRPSFSTLGRVAASLWFIALAFLFAQGLSAMVRAIPPGFDHFTAWAAIVSRCCTLIFYLTLGWLILIRPQALARRNGAVPMVVAFTGTYGVWLIPFVLKPYLQEPGQISSMLQIASAAVTLCGSLSIIYCVLYLGRSFSIVPQARKLVIGGPYRFVRHPLYVAEEIAVIGILMQYAWYAALTFLIIHMGLQISRMKYEESLLRAVFPDYEAYARRTARLIPFVW